MISGRTEGAVTGGSTLAEVCVLCIMSLQHPTCDNGKAPLPLCICTCTAAGVLSGLAGVV